MSLEVKIVILYFDFTYNLCNKIVRIVIKSFIFQIFMEIYVLHVLEHKKSTSTCLFVYQIQIWWIDI